MTARDNLFDIVCSGCEYRQLTYCAKAEDYGQDGVGWYCNKEEWGVRKCPRSSEWKRMFQMRAKEGGGHA